jgi:hypothetical protein
MTMAFVTCISLSPGQSQNPFVRDFETGLDVFSRVPPHSSRYICVVNHRKEPPISKPIEPGSVEPTESFNTCISTLRY